MKGTRKRKTILSIFTLFVMLFTQFLPIVSYAEDGMGTKSLEPVVDTYTYQFFDIDDSLYSTQIIKNNESLKNPGIPDRPGVFLGWYEGDTKINFNTPIEVTETKTISVNARFDNTKVDVTFIAEGEVISVKKLPKGETVNFSNVLVPPKEGYQHTGWSINPSGIPKFDTTTILTEDLTLYVVYEEKHMVTLHTNGGIYLAPVYVTDGHNLEGLIPTTTRAGYVFSHWSTTLDGEPYNLSNPVTGPMDLYAIWTPGTAKYTVQYWVENADDDGYSFLTSKQRSDTTEKIATYSLLVGSDFGITNTELAKRYEINTIKTDDASVNIKGDGTTVRNVYYSRKVYTLSFYHKVGNKWTLIEAIQFKYNQNTVDDWTRISNNYPSLTWYTTKTGWTAFSNAPRMYDENFDVYGRSGGTIPHRIKYLEKSTSQSIKTDYTFKAGEVTLTSEDYIVIEGFDFDYAVDFRYIGQERVADLFYNRKSYDIVFFPNDGNAAIVVGNNPYESDISGKCITTYVEGETIREADGRVFAGWYSDSGFTSKYDFSDPDNKYMPAKNIVLYGKWVEPTVKIIIHAKAYGLSGNVNEVLITRGQTINEAFPNIQDFEDELIYDLPSGANPSDLICWVYLIEGELHKLSYEFNIPHDIHVYPVWKDQTAEIKYSAGDGGSGTQVDNNLYIIGANARVMNNTFQPNENMNFIYYIEESTGDIYYPGEIININKKTTTLIAMWADTTRPTQVIYKGNGGVLSDEVTTEYTVPCSHNQVITVQANQFLRPNFEFIGYEVELWDGSEYTTTIVQEGNKLLVTNMYPENNILKALWKVKNVNLTLTKVWKNANGGPLNNLYKFPIKIDLLRNGQSLGTIYTLNANNNYTYTLPEKVPLADKNTGQPYTYTIVESADDMVLLDNFNKVYSSNVTCNSIELIVTNKLKTFTGVLNIKKEFDNNDPINKLANPFAQYGIPSINNSKNNEKSDLSFWVTITGPFGYNERKEIFVDETITLNNLPFGSYTIIEDESTEYTTTYHENNTPILTMLDSEETVIVKNKAMGGDVTNRDLILTKTWKDGPEREKTDITITVSRKNSKNVIKTLNIQPNSVVEISSNVFKYTFNNLAIYDEYGKVYQYSVSETINSDIADQYTAGEIGGNMSSGFTVTNTYKQQMSEEDLIGNKVWVNVTEETDLPEIRLQLRRHIEGVAGTDEAVGTPQALVNNQVNFGQQYVTDTQGREYTYYVKEVFVNEDDPVIDNFTVVSTGMTVTNTLKSTEDMDGKLTINKYFDNQDPSYPEETTGAPARPRETEDLVFNLVITGPNGYEETKTIEVGTPLVLSNLYYGKYTITETDPNSQYNTTYDINPIILTKSAPTGVVNITNEIKDEFKYTSVKLTKTWKDGPKRKAEDITVYLTRIGSDNVSEEFTTLEPTTVNKISDYKYEYIFEELYKYDTNGYIYKYTVREEINSDIVDQYTAGEIGGNMSSGFTVTNQYTPLEIEIKALKTWNYPAGFSVTIPAVKLELWRNTKGVEESDELVESAKPLVNDEEVSFGKQPLTDMQGRTYNYYIKEILPDEAESDNWELTSQTWDPETGKITVVNTLKDPLGTLTIYKNFDNKDSIGNEVEGTYPEKDDTDIKFLVTITGPYDYEETREIVPGTPILLENLYYGDYEVEELDNGYSYLVSYKNQYPVITEKNPDVETTINNCIKEEYEKTFAILEKQWINGPERKAEDITVKIFRQQKNGKITEITELVDAPIIEASENKHLYSYRFNNLPMFDSKGYRLNYIFEEVVNVENYEAGEILPKDTGIIEYTVQNTYIVPEEEFIGEKVWKNPNPHYTPKIFFELYRKLEGQEDWDAEFVVKVEVIDDKADFGKQPLTTESGEKYEYFLKEVFEDVDEAKNWIITIEGMKVTNCPKPVIPDEDGGQGGADVLPNTGNIRLIDKLFILLAFPMLIGIIGIIIVLKDKKEKEAYKYAFKKIY